MGSTRQYIGARYTPVFYDGANHSWEWIRGVQYEPLTIVSYGNNTYISKMAVPANIGTPNENPIYWANTGNYNGAILDTNNKITELQQDAALAKKKKILWLGDSYTAGYGGIESFAVRLKNILTHKGFIFNYDAQGGAGFIGSGLRTYLDMLKTAPKIPYDVIYLQGILNDIDENGNIRPNLNREIEIFMDYVRKNYPGVPVVIFPCTKNRTLSRFNVMNSILGSCSNNGIASDKSAYMLLNLPYQFQSDNIHPSASGNSELLVFFLNKILCGCDTFLGNESDDNIGLTVYGVQMEIFIKNFKNFLNDIGDSINNGVVKDISNLYYIPFFYYNSTFQFVTFCFKGENEYPVLITFNSPNKGEKKITFRAIGLPYNELLNKNNFYNIGNFKIVSNSMNAIFG